MELTPLSLAEVIVVFSCLTLLLVDVLAVVLLVRHSNDWMAMLVALTLILLPPSFTSARQGLSGNWQTLGTVPSAASGVTFFLLLGLFPIPQWACSVTLALATLGADHGSRISVTAT